MDITYLLETATKSSRTVCSWAIKSASCYSECSLFVHLSLLHDEGKKFLFCDLIVTVCVHRLEDSLRCPLNVLGALLGLVLRRSVVVRNLLEHFNYFIKLEKATVIGVDPRKYLVNDCFNVFLFCSMH